MIFNSLYPSDIYTLTSEAIEDNDTLSPSFIIRDDILSAIDCENLLADCNTLIGPKLLDSNFDYNYNSIIDTNLRPARVGSLLDIHDNNVRGDFIQWITPDLCNQFKLSSLSSYVKGVIRLLEPMKEKLSLNNDFSIQLAVYPANQSSYLKHMDVDTISNMKKNDRKLSCIIYLNKSPKGGQLRIHLRNSSCSYIDIEPLFGRLVIFRSDKVEHEVLPTNSPRIALTIWASGEKNNSNMLIDQQCLNAKLYPSLPCAIDESNNNIIEDSIYVSVVAYRDTECKYTIDNLLVNASNPSRIYIGVVWQCKRDCDGMAYLRNDNVIFKDGSMFNDHIRLLEMNSDCAEGPCLARSIATSLWRGEKYFLQIDSHMRFRENWDTFLIQQFCIAKEMATFKKAILTTYPLGYYQPNIVPKDKRPTVIVPRCFNESGLLLQQGEVINIVDESINIPIKIPLWAAGFNFCESSTFHEVPYDPTLSFLFFGEEQSMTARLFTHGYDFFSPSETIVYHLWSRSYRPIFQDRLTSDKILKRTKAIDRVLAMFDPLNSNENTNLYGLGKRRNLQEFEKLIGISFQQKSMNENYDSLTNLNPGRNFKIDTCTFESMLNELHDKSSNNKLSALLLAQQFL